MKHTLVRGLKFVSAHIKCADTLVSGKVIIPVIQRQPLKKHNAFREGRVEVGDKSP